MGPRIGLRIDGGDTANESFRRQCRDFNRAFDGRVQVADEVLHHGNLDIDGV